MMRDENNYDIKNEMKHDCKFAGHKETSIKWLKMLLWDTVAVCSVGYTGLESNNTISQESSPAQPCSENCQKLMSTMLLHHCRSWQDNHGIWTVPYPTANSSVQTALSWWPQEPWYNLQTASKRGTPAHVLLISSKVQILVLTFTH